jgi:hypothetical protein
MIRRWRAPELLFSPTTYDAFDMFTPVPIADSEEEEEEEDEDPLEKENIKLSARTTLFDDGFGDIGLAGSIFRVLGTPTKESWLVCPP